MAYALYIEQHLRERAANPQINGSLYIPSIYSVIHLIGVEPVGRDAISSVSASKGQPLPDESLSANFWRILATLGAMTN